MRPSKSVTTGETNVLPAAIINVNNIACGPTPVAWAAAMATGNISTAEPLLVISWANAAVKTKTTTPVGAPWHSAKSPSAIKSARPVFLTAAPMASADPMTVEVFGRLDGARGVWRSVQQKRVTSVQDDFADLAFDGLAIAVDCDDGSVVASPKPGVARCASFQRRAACHDGLDEHTLGTGGWRCVHFFLFAERCQSSHSSQIDNRLQHADECEQVTCPQLGRRSGQSGYA